MIVYACDYGNGPIKIKSHGQKYWKIHRLKRIRQVEVVSNDPMKASELRFKIEWEKKAYETFEWRKFKPPKDIPQKVTRELVEHAKIWCPHKVQWRIPTTIPEAETQDWKKL